MTLLLAIVVLVVLAIVVGRAAWIVAGWGGVAAPHRAPVGDDDLVSAEPVAAAAWPAPALIRRPRGPGVVLIHGILGFDSLGIGPVRVDYFRRVAARLRGAGFEVTTARLPPLAGVPERAAALARLLELLPDDRLTLFAHSLGGLDARWALAHEGIADRVGALVTIGTPHGGTPLADLLSRFPIEHARTLGARFGLPRTGLHWLTTRRAAELDRELIAPAEVRCASVITATSDRARIHPLLRMSHAYLAKVAGPSDGLVPASSQRWGEVVGEHEVDHWAQVGWSGRHDAAAVVLDVLGRLGSPPCTPTSSSSTTSTTPSRAATGRPWRLATPPMRGSAIRCSPTCAARRSARCGGCCASAPRTSS